MGKRRYMVLLDEEEWGMVQELKAHIEARADGRIRTGQDVIRGAILALWRIHIQGMDPGK